MILIILAYIAKEKNATLECCGILRVCTKFTLLNVAEFVRQLTGVRLDIPHLFFSPPLSTTKQRRRRRRRLQQLLIADLLFAKTPFFSCHRPTQNSLGSPPTTPERDRFLSPFGQRIAFRSPLCWWRRWQVVAVRKKVPPLSSLRHRWHCCAGAKTATGEKKVICSSVHPDQIKESSERSQLMFSFLVS